VWPLALVLTANPPRSAADEVRLNAIGPPLTALEKKIADPNWLVAWLLQPSRLRPHTVMPDFGLAPAEAQAIARYLYRSTAAATGTAWQGGDAQRGARLFVSRGCRGCHAINPGAPSLTPRVPNLAGIGLKVRADWLFAWLRAPRAYDPQTPMPQLALTDGEILDLVAYLMVQRAGADVLAAAPRYDPAAPATGGTLVDHYECASCHRMNGRPVPPPPFDIAAGSARAADVALRDGRTLVEYYNCRGCHAIEGAGGAILEHLERKTFAPPTLEGEGARVQTSWLVEFLQQPTTLRPWLEMRMPDYGLSAAHAAALAEYFAALAQVPARDEPVAGAAADLTARGLRRLHHYKCAQCHPSSAALPAGVDPENLSINLLLAQTRLRPSWIQQFLARPKAIAGTRTRMPAVFYSVDGTPKVEHPDEDIAAIAAYLLHMTEPLDVALAKLAAERQAERPKPQTDWTTYEY
jgi:mono/diheme cytochrome c family protein